MLGYLTFIRIVSRNVATDRMKRSLSRIRRYFLDGPADMRLKFIPFDPYKADARTLWAPHRLGKGGWVETLGLVNALLVGGLMAAVVAVVLAVVAGVPAVVKAVPAIVKAWVCACAAIGSGVLAAGVAWCFLMYDAARRYRREMWKGADSFILERNAIATGRPERRARRIMRAREGSRWSLEERTWDGKPLTKEVAQVIFVLKGKFTFSGGPCDEVLKAEKGDLVYVPERMVFRTESEPLQRYLLGVWDNL
jgi:mannose-6-phosphate isomerase-like protein (cupin superfamily)